MAITLQQAKLGTTDALQATVIDEFRKNSFLLDKLPFDNCVVPSGNAAALTYAYTRIVTQPTAAFRAINNEYTSAEITKQKYTVDLKVFGGSFQVDRVIAEMGGIVDAISVEMAQKIKATKALFCDTAINGSSADNANAFDGLDKALTGSSTEWNSDSDGTVDFSSAANIEKNAPAFLLSLNKCLKKLDGAPTAIMGNGDLIAALEYAAKTTGRYYETKDEWGMPVSTYNGIPLIDLGAKAGSSADIVGTAATGDNAGCTSLYVARFGLDGFHGVSLSGTSPIKAWLPDFKTAGAVKKGEVEMIAAVALKSTKAAGVYRNIKIA